MQCHLSRHVSSVVGAGMLALGAPVHAQMSYGESLLMKALDVDGDGTLSALEIENAVAALRLLDDDGDGTLSKKELGTDRASMWDDWGDMDDWDDMDRDGRGRSGAAEGSVLEPDEVDFEHGTSTVTDRATFKKLSYKTGMVMDHLKGHEFVKFQIEELDTDAPKLYFINTATHPTHMQFMQAIGGRDGPDGMRGVLVYRPLLMAPNGEPGLYTFEFDLPKHHPFERIKLAYDLLQDHGPLLRHRLVYHPMQRAVEQHRSERARYETVRLPVIQTEELYSNIGFLPLHTAESFGRLRRMSPDERPNPRDIVICEVLPNEMPRVAGIVSAALQTPLSHVNLRAIQDNVPNAYIKGAAENETIRRLIGQYVFYRVAEDGFEIREATLEEVNAHHAAARPLEPRVPERDLSVTQIRPLADITFGDASSVGVKAANLATLRRLEVARGFTSEAAPDGFAVPFHYYDAFMKHNGFYEEARTMRSTPGFRGDTETRDAALARFRRMIKKGRVPEWMASELGNLHRAFPPRTSLRCRSSTNNEDLPGFSGAGLYDSFTHHPDEGHLSKSIKQVFAGLWTFRAYEEREFFRVDHFATAMGVLVHPNFSDERANGVAVSEDIVYQTAGNMGRMYYVNAQVGEDLVTNPSEQSVPEELLISPRFPRDDMIMRSSNRVESGVRVLEPAHVAQLRVRLKTIHRAFRSLYGKAPDAPFAMEVEFKVTTDDELVIKQARPWVFP